MLSSAILHHQGELSDLAALIDKLTLQAYKIFISYRPKDYVIRLWPLKRERKYFFIVRAFGGEEKLMQSQLYPHPHPCPPAPTAVYNDMGVKSQTGDTSS